MTKIRGNDLKFRVRRPLFGCSRNPHRRNWDGKQLLSEGYNLIPCIQCEPSMMGISKNYWL